MIKEKAHAKLNLNLHILPHKLVNGFYEVNLLNCELDLCDGLVFEEMNREIRIISDNPTLPKMKKNLIYQAAALLKNNIGNDNLGVKITLKKNIPVKAGLGGGSSDAAATVRGLAKLWNIKLNEDKLFDLANNLGRDVFYSLKGGLCEIKGDGSEVVKLSVNVPIFWLIIITPDIKKPSTEWMYQHLDPNKIGKHIDTLARFKHKQNLSDLHNDFEMTAFKYFPQVKQIKKDLEKSGAKKTLLAGSGLSMIGFYEKEKEKDEAYQILNKSYNNVICTKIR